MPYDPILRAAKVESIVMSGNKRRYHRFRAAPYYGGIVTADALGCNLLCAYCWNYFRNLHPNQRGKLYSPKEVAENLIHIAKKKGFHLYRITGSEPILGEASLNHFIDVHRLVMTGDPECRFVLETNGLMLGWHPNFCERLPKEGLMVRVALKGIDEKSFEKITDAKGEFFKYQLAAIEMLQRCGIDVWCALMGDLFDDSEISSLKELLKKEGITSDLELEYLEKYPYVIEMLSKKKILIKRDRPYNYEK